MPLSTRRSDLRVADADRHAVAQLLQRHYVDGRLGQDELDERLEAALAARTFGDLDPLLADLPPLRPADPPANAVSPRSPKDLRAHITSYLLVMALLLAIWLLTTPGGYFWPIWPMLGWGIGLTSHALGWSGGCHTPRRDNAIRNW